jgi:hypothetical protein
VKGTKVKKTLTIKMTEITWRQTMEDYTFMVQVIEDGSCTFSRKYGTALDAVNAYNSFKDHGMCRYTREIVLVEPNGEIHAKTFAYPASVPIG